MTTPSIPTTPRAPDWRWCAALTLLLLLATWGVRLLSAHALQAPTETLDRQALERGVPQAFAGWQLLDEGVVQVGTNANPGAVDPRSPYTEQLVRSYRDSQGRAVMLTLAHVGALTAYTRPHPPEDCYKAAGFDIVASREVRLQALEPAGMVEPLLARHMLAQRNVRHEAVVYWSRIGALYGATSLASRWHMTMGRLEGAAPDGILVRVSMLVDGDADPAAAYAALERFLGDLLAASPPDVQQLMRRT